MYNFIRAPCPFITATSTALTPRLFSTRSATFSPPFLRAQLHPPQLPLRLAARPGPSAPAHPRPAIAPACSRTALNLHLGRSQVWLGLRAQLALRSLIARQLLAQSFSSNPSLARQFARPLANTSLDHSLARTTVRSAHAGSHYSLLAFTQPSCRYCFVVFAPSVSLAASRYSSISPGHQSPDTSSCNCLLREPLLVVLAHSIALVAPRLLARRSHSSLAVVPSRLTRHSKASQPTLHA